MAGRPPGGLRVTGLLFGLLAVFGIFLVGLDAVTGGALPDIRVGTWNVPAGVPTAIVAVLIAKVCLDAANRRDARP
ncbi:hypothetical protein [Micromonospora costi]|uniref:Uncharacterized protein n=1 Tax=Micromonospora costi TaxID=1530042 RepID=A0A3B0A6K5_9ACTN|nr:hypothetical protein [Micromonospora costi]RKN56003.1 hypothetical protein D7193_15575 [Micromonospora costi]